MIKNIRILSPWWSNTAALKSITYRTSKYYLEVQTFLEILDFFEILAFLEILGKKLGLLRNLEKHRIVWISFYLGTYAMMKRKKRQASYPHNGGTQPRWNWVHGVPANIISTSKLFCWSSILGYRKSTNFQILYIYRQIH